METQIHLSQAAMNPVRRDLLSIYLGSLSQPSQPAKDILWKFLWVDPGKPL